MTSESADRLWLAIEERDLDEVKAIFKDKDEGTRQEICLHELRKLVLQKSNHRDSLTCLHFVAKRGVAKVLKEMISSTEELDVNVKTSIMGWTPLHYAAFGGNLSLTHALLKHGSKLDIQGIDGKCPVHVAILRGHRKIAANLIPRMRTINMQDTKGNTLLHYCVDDEVMAKTGWSDEERTEMVEFLLMHGCETNLKNNSQHTPLQCAVQNEVEGRTLELLLDKVVGTHEGVNLRDDNGCTLLHLAKHDMLVKVLLKRDVDVNIKDTNGQTALHKQIQYPEITELLLKNGADALIKDGNGRVPIHLIVQQTSPHLDCLNLHIEANNSISSIQDNDGKTPLHLACERIYYDVTVSDILDGVVKKKVEKNSDPIIEALLEGQVEINAINKLGQTPLLTALVKGFTFKADILVAQGASLNVFDKIGRSPRTIASKWYSEAVRTKPQVDKCQGNLQNPSDEVIVNGNLNSKQQNISMNTATAECANGKLSKDSNSDILKENSERTSAKAEDAKQKSVSTPWLCCFPGFISPSNSTSDRRESSQNDEDPVGSLSRQITQLQDDVKEMQSALEEVSGDKSRERNLEREVTNLQEDVKNYTQYLEKVTGENAKV